MGNVPKRVREACETHPSPVNLHPFQDVPVTIGDLRMILPAPSRPADSRIALVTDIIPESGLVVLALVHTAPELATSWDAVVPTPLASTPYVVIVQADLRGAVWVSQLGKRVGYLPEEVLAAVRAVVRSSIDAAPIRRLGIYSGTPLRSALDGRWAFKKAEGEALQRLALTLDELP